MHFFRLPTLMLIFASRLVLCGLFESLQFTQNATRLCYFLGKWPVKVRVDPGFGWYRGPGRDNGQSPPHPRQDAGPQSQGRQEPAFQIRNFF